VTSKEKHQGRHADEVPNTRSFISSKERGDTAELYGPVDRDAAQDPTESKEWNYRVSKLLECIVLLLRRMLFSDAEIIEDHWKDSGRVRLSENCGATAMPSEYIIENIDNTVDGEKPHAKEVPHPSPGKPAAERNIIGKSETKKRRRIVNPPATRNHDQQRNRIHPVRDSDEDWMMILFLEMALH
jgi:hypothetical protein